MPVAISSRLFLSEPILGFAFVVTLGADPLAYFTECSGLGIERDVKVHPEGGVNDYEHQLPGRVKYPRITLKRGLAGTKLWDWFQEGLYTCQVERRHVTITLFTANLLQMQAWSLTDAYPTKWTGPSFNTANTEVAVESLELVHHGLQMVAIPLL